MDNLENINLETENESKINDVVYSPDKDFYKGIGGELRFKAEGLFKKAKEKGISIEEIDVSSLKENKSEFPGLGEVDLPAFIVKVKGRHAASGQIIIDAKQIDYFNRYQKYAAEKIEKKNLLRDEKGKVFRENGIPRVKSDMELFLTEWERFEIGKSLVDDKEFGLEKTITGACDRVIRKLMGENDWLYPDEARLLDEEFNAVQEKVVNDLEKRRQVVHGKRATERQINYLKAKIKNTGLDPEDDTVKKEVIRQAGIDLNDYMELSTGEASKIIDSVGVIIPKVREALTKINYMQSFGQDGSSQGEDSIRQ